MLEIIDSENPYSQFNLLEINACGIVAQDQCLDFESFSGKITAKLLNFGLSGGLCPLI